jgi:hypothetical protein
MTRLFMSLISTSTDCALMRTDLDLQGETVGILRSPQLGLFI